MSRLVFLLVLLTGCATVRPQEAFDEVQTTLAERTDLDVTWATDSDEDAAVDAAVSRLLADSLTADAAVQIAVLQNRRLQATYEELGVAQAALVQAGLLANPVFRGSALFPFEGDAPATLGLGAALQFLDVFAIPLRRSVARAEYQAAQLRVAEAVLDLAAETRTAFVQAQAARLRVEMQQRLVANAEAGYQAALLLREAGNVPAVELLAEQALYEQARLDLVSMQAQAAERREALARRLGVFGDQASFQIAGALPPVPPVQGDALAGDATDAAALERQAVAASLALAAARLDAEAVARRMGLTNLEAGLPDFEVGAEAERDDGAWKAGPEVEVTLPLFDQGQARLAAARAELRRRRALLYATAVDVRSAARVLALRLDARARTARHYQSVVLPLRAEITAQTVRQYNAMQTGVFGLLQAQAAEVDAARRYVDALADYWVARADIDALRQGRMPPLGTEPPAAESSSPMMESNAH